MLKFILCLIPYYSISQTSTDTLPAAAYRNNFMVGSIFGITSNGHVYNASFNLNYNASGGSLETDVYRIDLATKEVTTKKIPGSISAPSMFWKAILDFKGRMILGLNSNRDIYIINLKDSIWIKNLGRFQTGELAYTIQLGRDSNTYVGGSSGPFSTLWGTIVDTTFTEHPVIDEQEGYVLSILGDTNYVVAQVGQNPYKMYVIRKSDDYKKKLANQETWFSTGVKNTGLFYQDNTFQYYKVTDTTAIPVTPQQAGGIPIDYREVNVDYVQQAGLPLITGSFYDAIKQKYFWTLNGNNDSLSVSSSSVKIQITRIFNDAYDNNILYYVGAFYGNWYRYNKTTGVSTELGFAGLNTFDAKQVNDTTWYICGYPSGTLVKWVTTQPWTAETFFNGSLHHISATTNPKLIGYWRSETTAGFHEAVKIIQLPNGMLFSGGNEIRSGATTSIGGYNPANGDFWGLNRDSIYGLNFSDITPCHNDVIFSTNSIGNVGTAKLFRYDSERKTLVDSFDFGFTDYGKIYCIGDFLLGVVSNRLYKVNLSTKQLVYNYVITGGTINRSQILDDFSIGINTTGTVVIPTDFWPTKQVSDMRYSSDGTGNYYALYNNQGQSFQILKKNGVTTYSVNPETAEGKQKILIERFR